MNARTLLHGLLTIALMEIRNAAKLKRNIDDIAKISDLLHNLPSSLEKAARGERSYDAALQDVLERANMRGCHGWVEHTLNEVRKLKGEGSSGRSHKKGAPIS